MICPYCKKPVSGFDENDEPEFHGTETVLWNHEERGERVQFSEVQS